MKRINSIAFGLVMFQLAAFAQVNIDVSIVRPNANTVNICPAIPLILGQPYKRVYQDTHTYIEAELVKENDQEVLVQFTVATLENNRLVVRGMPKLNMSLENGLSMSSLHCDGDNEHFMMVVAAAKDHSAS